MADVLLVTEHYPPDVGGSASLFEGIYSRLVRERVVVLTDERGAAAHDEHRGPVRIVRRPIATQRWGILHPAALGHHARTARSVRRIAGRARAIVHCGRALPEGIAAWMARRLGGPAYVCWAHGEDLATAQTSRELRAITRRVFRGAAAAIANSRHTAGLLERIGVRRDRVHVVYPGVDARRFHPQIDGGALRRRLAEPGEVLLLSVGRLQRRKGHDLVLGAIAALRDRTPRVRYVVVGDGAERERLRALASWHRLEAQVHFAGEVRADELPMYYAACDVFVLPNRLDGADLEGFGLVFLEAAASGKPAIGGRSGGVPEAVVDGETGLLVGGREVAELAAAIERLARSEEARRRMGHAARARAVADFSWRRGAETIARVNAQVRAAHGGGAC